MMYAVSVNFRGHHLPLSRFPGRCATMKPDQARVNSFELDQTEFTGCHCQTPTCDTSTGTAVRGAERLQVEVGRAANPLGVQPTSAT
jgi:hypothetical protein